MNQLDLHWIKTTVRLDGVVEVDSLGFCVDGQRMEEWLRWVAGEQAGLTPLKGLVSRFARCFPRDYLRTAYRELLMLDRSELPDGRTQLYACPCGDPGCGGLFVEVARRGACLQWARFGGLDTVYTQMPNLRFEWSQYKTALAGARGLFT